MTLADPSTGEEPDRGQASGARSFAWGFVAQGFSSAANFGLSVVVGRLLGPSGLGVFFIGFAAYQLALGLQRAAITQPLIARAAPLGAFERARLSHSGLTAILVTGLITSCFLALVGSVVGGALGRGLLLFAPWITAGLLQEFWKAVLFQEGQGGMAAISDATRLAVMAVALPLAISHKSEHVIVGAWGIAALVAFGVGTSRLRARAGRLAEAFTWLREEAWMLGRWLSAREVVFQVGSYVTVLVLAVVLGSKDLGGLRAAEALFSPFSLIAAAFALPALPALSRALTSSRGRAQRMAIRISAAAAALGITYFITMIVSGGWLLTYLYGESFSPFRGLIWPMAVSQLFYTSSFAFTALLIVERRGVALFVVGTVGAVVGLVLVTALAFQFGVTGAAWGMAGASAVASVLVVLFGFQAETKGSRALPAQPDGF